MSLASVPNGSSISFAMTKMARKVLTAKKVEIKERGRSVVKDAMAMGQRHRNALSINA